MALTRRRTARGLAAAVVVLAAVASAHSLSPAVASAQAMTISPLPGTQDASPKTQISFLGAPASSISDVSVVGNESGGHSGHLEGYSTGTGASFLLARPLDQGEQVRVSAKVSGKAVGTDFTVARWVTYNFGGRGHPPKYVPSLVQSFVSAPNLHPPDVDITTTPQAGAADGDVFVAPNRNSGQWGPMIVNQQGQLVWFDAMPTGTDAMDFRVEAYEGQPDLVWWQGYIPSIGVGYGVDEIYNSRYQKVGQIQAGNGYKADLHEVNITPQGTAFITAYTIVQANLSSADGSGDGALLEPVIQEIDIKTGLVMFEWDPLGRVALSDSFTHPVSSTYPWDWFHANSISIGPSDDILIDSRNTWAAYDVSLKTGQILWRLGGRHPSFNMGKGTGMAYQHDAEWQPDGTITVFDDGSAPPVHPQSRTIRLKIDWSKRSVSLVNQFEHTHALLSPSQGNDQVLSNGDSFVGWGQAGYLTEFSASGATLFDAHFPYPGQSYRAYLLPWSATPAARPEVAAKVTAAGKATVYASWNGATDIAAWRVLGGPDSAHLSQIADTLRTGFETAIPVATGQDTLAAVQALDANGKVLATSATTKL
jgi:hypothetical protein